MSNKTSRRDFLKTGAAGSIASAAAFNKFLVTLTASLPYLVQANEVSQIMNYLCLWTGGGPQRRLFDLPLMHEGSSINFGVENGTQLTSVDNPAVFASKYTTINYKGLNLPYLNSATIPTVGGGTAKMYQLFDNALIMRGVVLPTAGHMQNTELFMRPNLGASSLQALVAESSSSPMPSVDLASGLPYMSLQGKGRIIGSTGAPMMSILQHFNNNAAYANSYKVSDIENKIDNLLGIFQKRYEKLNPNVAKIYADRTTAKNILKSNLGAYIDMYDTVYAKYQLLLNSAIKAPKLAGVFDPVRTRNTNESKTTSGLYNVGNGRNTGIIQNEYVHEIAAEANLDAMASSLALSEILLVENLSQSICVDTSLVNSLYRLNDSGGKVLIDNTHDSHSWGGHLIFYLENLYFYGLATGLTELITTLKNTQIAGKSVYENTVIQLASEFPGTMHLTEGQGHQHEGQCTTLFSGRFKNPLVVGNIRLGTKTVGDGAPVDALAGRYMNIGNMSSTVAEIIGVKSPTPNDASVASVNFDGSLVSKIGTARTIG